MRFCGISAGKLRLQAFILRCQRCLFIIQRCDLCICGIQFPTEAAVFRLQGLDGYAEFRLFRSCLIQLRLQFIHSCLKRCGFLIILTGCFLRCFRLCRFLFRCFFRLRFQLFIFLIQRIDRFLLLADRVLLTVDRLLHHSLTLCGSCLFLRLAKGQRGIQDILILFCKNYIVIDAILCFTDRFEYIILQGIKAIFPPVEFLNLCVDLTAHTRCAGFETDTALSRLFNSVLQCGYSILELCCTGCDRLCTLHKLCRSGNCLFGTFFEVCGTAG